MTTSVAPELLNQSSGLGYTTGSGGTVTQLTSKATGVTLNKPVGKITLHNSALSGGAIETFQVVNSFISANDVVILNFNGNFVASYTMRCTVYDGSMYITIKNETAGSLSDAVVINFAVINGVTS